MRFADLWSTEGTIDRGPYALVGVIGFAVKHNLDRLLATGVFHRKWSLFNYWIPLDRAVRVNSLDAPDRTFLLWMLVLSLPFIWVGVALTTRRLRAMGLPLWLVALFFVPYLNLLFFLVLCVYPSQSEQDLAKPPRARENRTLAKIIPDSNWGSAAMALLISSVLGIAATLLSVSGFLAVYGFGLFVALPFCLGLCSVLLHGYHRPRSLRSCLLVATLSIALLGLFLLALAVEGAICLAMAAPIGLALGLMGGLVGYWIQRRTWSELQTQATFGAMLLFVPFLMGAEALKPLQPELLQVRTQIEIVPRLRLYGTFWLHSQLFRRRPNGRFALGLPIQSARRCRAQGLTRAANVSSRAVNLSSRSAYGRRTSASSSRFRGSLL